MAVYVYGFTGSALDLIRNNIIPTLQSFGVDCSEGSSYGITINKWNDITNKTVPSCNVGINSGSWTYAIRTDNGKEFLTIVNASGQSGTFTTGNNMSYLININGNLVVQYQTLYSSFEFPFCALNISQNLQIKKCLLLGGTNGGTQPYDISDLGFYNANGLVSPNVIYKDAFNNEYMGINQYLLVKKE